MYVFAQRQDDAYSVFAVLLVPALMALLAVVAKLPFDFYSALRVAVSISCGFVAISSWRLNARLTSLPFAMLTVLFNPLLPIRLSRTVWVAIDASTGLFLIAAALVYYWINREPAKPVTIGD